MNKKSYTGLLRITSLLKFAAWLIFFATLGIFVGATVVLYSNGTLDVFLVGFIMLLPPMIGGMATTAIIYTMSELIKVAVDIAWNTSNTAEILYHVAKTANSKKRGGV